MSVQVRCPEASCGIVFRVAVVSGKPMRCTACGNLFTPPQAVPPPLRPQATKVNPIPPTRSEGPSQQVGRFVVRHPLGAGAFATVYRAHDPHLDREVALKVPHPGILASPSTLARFLGEARAAARLHHPNIVPIYEAAADESVPYIASAFIEGRTLAQALDDGPVDGRHAAELVLQLAEALAYAHKMGVIHRDVKPSNILIDAQGRPHLADFGLAFCNEAGARLTPSGAVLGTPAYMAPEQAEGRQEAPPPACDQYSLGAVLYELLSGQPPFVGPVPAVIYHAIHCAPQPPRQRNPKVPPELERICLKALAKKPHQRYPSCQEMAEALRNWLEKPTTRAPRANVKPSGFDWRPRHPVLLGTVASLIVVLAVLAFIAWRALRRLPPPSGMEDGLVAAIPVSPPSSTKPVDVPPPKTSPTTNFVPPPRTTKPINPPPTTLTTPPPPTTAKGSITPPNKQRARAGKYTHDLENVLPTILLRKEAKGGAWQRLGRNDEVHTSDSLMSLPGYASEVRLDSGVRLVLRGLVPEFSRDPLMAFLLESAVVLHKNADLDADLTLDRGRLYISNTKDNGPATVRLRFGKDGGEVWDLTLEEPDTEIGIDLPKNYARDITSDVVDEPRMELYLQVLHGRAAVRVTKAFVTYPNLVPPPGPGFFEWDNYRGEVKGPQVITNKEVSERIWRKSPPTKMENPAADEMVLAIKELSTRMVTKQPPTFYLSEVLAVETTMPAGRRLPIYCMCSLDDVRGMLDALGDEHDGHGGDRETAIYALRRWLARDAGQSGRLYDPKTKMGLLQADALAKTYKPMEARTIAELLRNFTDAERQAKETYDLLATHMRSSKVAIAELAYWHLRRLASRVKVPNFNAAWPLEMRESVVEKVREMIEKRELPPPEGAPGDGGKPMGPSKPGTG